MALLHRPIVIWCVLVGVTLLSVTMAELGSAGIVGYFVVFAAAVLKGQLVAVNFMETPHALPVWNSLYRIWIVVIGLALFAGVAFVH